MAPRNRKRPPAQPAVLAVRGERRPEPRRATRIRGHRVHAHPRRIQQQRLVRRQRNRRLWRPSVAIPRARFSHGHRVRRARRELQHRLAHHVPRPRTVLRKGRTNHGRVRQLRRLFPRPRVRQPVPHATPGDGKSRSELCRRRGQVGLENPAGSAPDQQRAEERSSRLHQVPKLRGIHVSLGRKKRHSEHHDSDGNRHRKPNLAHRMPGHRDFVGTRWRTSGSPLFR